MPSVPFVCIFPFFLSFFFLPFIPFSLFFSLYSRRYRFLVSTVWSKKPRLISHRASLGEGTTTMSNRKLLISGQHFPLFSLSLSLYVCLCLSVSFSLSLSLWSIFPPWNRPASEFDAKKHWNGTSTSGYLFQASCRSNRASWTPGKRWPLALAGQTVNRGHCDQQRFSALPLSSFRFTNSRTPTTFQTFDPSYR